MTKIEQRYLTAARELVALDMLDAAARVIASIHRSTRRRATQAAALKLVVELGLVDRVTMHNNCLVHVADVSAVRS